MMSNQENRAPIFKIQTKPPTLYQSVAALLEKKKRGKIQTKKKIT